MENLSNKLTTGMLLLLLSFTFVNAQNIQQAQDTSECLQLSLRIVDMADRPFEGSSIKVIQNNVTAYEIEKENKSKHRIMFNRNTSYLLEINFPGYITRRVVVSTKQPKMLRNTAIYRHSMDIVMIPEVEGIKNSEFIDFPAGVISYNQKTDKFESDRKYMNCLRKDFEEAKIKAKKAYTLK